ncbi:MAG: N-acetylglucosamine-6-phosphate deacetylase [Peptostreptococcaceae bacterium]|nr:N-acetylglucosamine-6-phosphate deacetylase [Peptostreptococcaceae bacterium]
MKYIKAKSIVLEDRMQDDAILAIRDGKIAAILEKLPEGAEFIDHSQHIVAPGFVDTHIHGMVGHDIMDATEEGLLAISKAAARIGVTSFLPTTLTASVEDTDRAIINVAKNHHKVEGAKVRGIFLEGPFFAEKYKGAQNPLHFRDPQLDLLKHWVGLAEGLPIKIAVAPELEGSMEFIRGAKEIGVTIALGHTDATYDQVKEAVDNGASIFVHMYNAMSPLHHRDPGMVGAGLTLKDVFAELICDGHHVHPAAAQIVVGMRKSDATALITDCMSATCMPDGDYKLGDLDVKVANGTAKMENGGLAGSVLLLKDAVKNVVKWGIATPFEAIGMASLTPARSVGIDDVCGKIAVGYAADLVALDENLDVVATYLDGERVKASL